MVPGSQSHAIQDIQKVLQYTIYVYDTNIIIILLGSKEEKEILEWIKTLPPDHWTVFLNSWPNNSKNGPSLILLEKLVPHSMRKSR